MNKSKDPEPVYPKRYDRSRYHDLNKLDVNRNKSSLPTIKLPRIRLNYNRRNIYISIIAFLVIISGFLFIEYNQAKSTLSASNVSKIDDQELAALGKIYMLPKNQNPIFRTVSNASKLSSETFFAHAQNGDKLIIYTGSHLAILYRPSTDMIINVATVNVSSSTSE